MLLGLDHVYQLTLIPKARRSFGAEVVPPRLLLLNIAHHADFEVEHTRAETHN